MTPPFALVGPAAQGLRLTAVTPAARAMGLVPGQKLADARAAVPHLLTAPAEPEADAQALGALAAWCGRYGPRRHVEADDGLWIDITGVPHLFGGEDELLADLVRRLRSFGLTPRVGLASTSGAAWGLARFGPGKSQARPWSVAPQDDPAGAERLLSALPVAALRLDGDTRLLLRRLGLVRVGQLTAIPRTALARRFQAPPNLRKGRARSRSRLAQDAAEAAVAVLDAVDRLFGGTPDALVPLVEPPRHLVRLAFAEPLISTEGIETAVARLAGDLAISLSQTQEGARQIRLALFRVDGTVASLEVGTSAPTRDARHVLNLVDERLSSIDAGFGVDVLTLEASATEALAGTQAVFAAAGEGAGDDPGLLIDRLSNRLGRSRVLRLLPSESHVPERAQVRVPALSAGAVGGGPPEAGAIGRAPRPAILLPRPEPVLVLAEVPDGPPIRFTWRRIGRRVARAEGPERIGPEWWRDIGRSVDGPEGPVPAVAARPRDYYRIEDEHGGRYWMFRDGLFTRSDADEDVVEPDAPPRWFMHGVFP